MEEDIKLAESLIKEYKLYGDLDGIAINDMSAYINAMEHLIKAYKELEEEKELNKIIKNTKLDELFTRPRRNGKTIELAMRLREEILKLPECKLYGIKNCKNKVVLLTKEECIPVSLVEEKIEELNKAYEDSKDENGESEYYYPDYTISVLQELLEKRK